MIRCRHSLIDGRRHLLNSDYEHGFFARPVGVGSTRANIDQSSGHD
jgi:hypothetical protein